MPIYRRFDKNRPEIVDPKDLPLSREEALACATITDQWPGGLGEVLVPDAKQKRGFKRDPSFSVFKKDYSCPSDALKCPVMVIKEMRGWPHGEYAKHLSAWRSLRDAYAKVLGLDLKAAHELYNEHLRSTPREMSKVLRQYAELV